MFRQFHSDFTQADSYWLPVEYFQNHNGHSWCAVDIQHWYRYEFIDVLNPYSLETRNKGDGLASHTACLCITTCSPTVQDLGVSRPYLGYYCRQIDDIFNISLPPRRAPSLRHDVAIAFCASPRDATRRRRSLPLVLRRDTSLLFVARQHVRVFVI